MAYSEKVIEHYENPRNVGSFDKDDPMVGTGLVGAPACGGPSWNSMTYEKPEHPPPRMPRRRLASSVPRFFIWRAIASTAFGVTAMAGAFAAG